MANHGAPPPQPRRSGEAGCRRGPIADAPSPTAIALAGAAATRHVDRHPYSPAPVPRRLLDELVEAGARHRAHVRELTGDDRYTLARAFAKAAAKHSANEDYRAELAACSGRSAEAVEGIPRTAAPESGVQYGDLVVRDFGHVAFVRTELGTARTAGALLLISTSSDDTTAQLFAGEATGAVLCTAELRGLSASPLSEGFELEQTRSDIRREVLADIDYPQLALRAGRPARARHPPPTYRISADEVVRDLIAE